MDFDPSESNTAMTFLKQNWLYATPLIAAPLIPAVRVALRNHPRIRNATFFTLIGVFTLHGFSLFSRAGSGKDGPRY